MRSRILNAVATESAALASDAREGLAAVKPGAAKVYRAVSHALSIVMAVILIACLLAGVALATVHWEAVYAFFAEQPETLVLLPIAALGIAARAYNNE